jgi:hypothetical protein
LHTGADDQPVGGSCAEVITGLGKRTHPYFEGCLEGTGIVEIL